jgi:GTP-binding protein
MEIKKAEYLISNADYEMCPKGDRPEYAFIGRSNVGKSSLINMICLKSKLAKTSSAPGKTQLINNFEIEASIKNSRDAKKWYLVDLPGYGFAKVAQSSRRRWEQMIENYLRKRTNLTHVFVLIDSRHKPQKIDLEFIGQLDFWEIPFSLVFTKTDKEKPTVVANNIKAFLDTLRATWQFLPQHFVTSAEKKQGREEILQFIEMKNESVA